MTPSSKTALAPRSSGMGGGTALAISDSTLVIGTAGSHSSTSASTTPQGIRRCMPAPRTVPNHEPLSRARRDRALSDLAICR